MHRLIIRQFGAHKGESRVEIHQSYIDAIEVHTLKDHRNFDNSRDFVGFKSCFDAEWLLRKTYDCLAKAPRSRRAKVVEFVSDFVTATYIDFRYGDHLFTIHQGWTLMASVRDPECPDELLVEVTKLLVPYFGPLES
ncbi:MAG: hypothetical protein ACIAQF_12865 [Phycisphaerales bacterium JB065]